MSYDCRIVIHEYLNSEWDNAFEQSNTQGCEHQPYLSFLDSKATYWISDEGYLVEQSYYFSKPKNIKYLLIKEIKKL
jgi:hypothetical protein